MLVFRSKYRWSLWRLAGPIHYQLLQCKCSNFVVASTTSDASSMNHWHLSIRIMSSIESHQLGIWSNMRRRRRSDVVVVVSHSNLRVDWSLVGSLIRRHQVDANPSRRNGRIRVDFNEWLLTCCCCCCACVSECISFSHIYTPCFFFIAVSNCKCRCLASAEKLFSFMKVWTFAHKQI